MKGSPMHMRSLAIAGIFAVIIALLPATAHADTALRRDARGDAPSAIDITRVQYRHARQTVSVRVRIPDLQRRGRVLLRTTRFNIFEAGYIAELRIRRNGSLSKRLLYFDHFDVHPRRCAVGGSWNARAGVVRVSVPRACLDGHRRQRLYVDAISALRQRSDNAPAVKRLARG
jgi:hypothetical protein